MSDTNTKMDGSLGLDGMSLSGLMNDEQAEQTAAASGKPMELPMDLIDEDPEQPRKEDNPGFLRSSLQEMAQTIQDRGVKSPISVRESDKVEGRFIINHGARRYRASKLAKKRTIPAFIDNDFSDADQVIENLQRNELTAREIAVYIGRELSKGFKKKEIAESLGKSGAFVTQHVALLDLPEPLAAAFNSQRVKDVTVINELLKAYKANPDVVESWLADEDQEITRATVKLLREFIDTKDQEPGGQDQEPGGQDLEPGGQDQEPGGQDLEPGGQDLEPGGAASKEVDPDKISKAIVMVSHDGRQARLVLNRRPPADGWAWLRYEDDGHEIEVDLGEVQLMAVIEG